MQKANSADWKDWLRYAEDDKEHGEYLKGFASEGAAKAITLTSHQLVEHSLKAFYIYKTKKLPPRTHDLSELARLCASYGLQLSEDEKSTLETLHGFYIPLRYPQPAETLPTKEEALQLLAEASALFEKIRSQLK
ncbi:MAG: hypothetical protein DRP82_05280 [Planctomycetota bacterium]|nr:MAG: hypothetical protein DRP82_05280 [Planctomycetota bacterium]